MQKITTCLWFENRAEEAINFYATVFPNAKIKNVMRNGNALVSAMVEIHGFDLMVLNGARERFNQTHSMMIDCETQAEVDLYWSKLLEGGEPSRCGWLFDKFGVSWQIVPTRVFRLFSDKDTVKAGRAMQAMMKMIKLDIDEIQRAFDGK